MPLTVPPAVNYPSPLYFIPNKMLEAYGSPAEGAGSISVEIDWGTMGGSNQCVGINPNSNTINPQQISQIAALYIDNSQSQADVRYVFTDTGLTITIPSFSGGLFPVVSNSLNFYVLAGSAIPTDVTRFLILNVNPPPVQIAQPSVMQEVSAFNNIPAAAGTTALIIAGIDGTVRNIAVSVSLGAGSGNFMTWAIQDGTGHTLFAGQFSDNAAASNTAVNGMIFALNDVDASFVNGLNLVMALTGAGFSAHSAVAVNIVYETP